MDINNLKSCISHDEATIRSFVRNPKFAEYYLNTVITDGDEAEIKEVQSWYEEAKKRSQNEALKISYPSRLAVNSKFVTVGAVA